MALTHLIQIMELKQQLVFTTLYWGLLYLTREGSIFFIKSQLSVEVTELENGV